MTRQLKPGSLCLHSGYEPKNGEPIELPIVQSTTFKYDNSDEMAMLFDLKKDGYFYTRLANPTSDAVARKICSRQNCCCSAYSTMALSLSAYRVSLSS